MLLSKLTYSLLLVAAVTELSAGPSQQNRICTAVRLNEFLLHAKPSEFTSFSITGIVQYTTATNDAWFCLKDHTTRTYVARGSNTSNVKAGDKVSITGYAALDKNGEPFPYVDKLSILGHAQTDPVVDLRINELEEAAHNHTLVRVKGTIIDIFDDDIDESNCFLLLKEEENTIPIAVPKAILSEPRVSLIDATVQVCGIYIHCSSGIRKYSSPIILLNHRSDIIILHQAPKNPFDAPTLESRLYLSPKRIISMGRRTVQGQIIATWGGNHLLVREMSGRIIKVELAENTPLPKYGDACLLVGYPQTDTFRINLTRALCRHIDNVNLQPNPPEDVSASHIITNSWRLSGTQELYHGHLIRIKGIVRSIPNANSKEQLLILDNEGYSVPVDISSNPTIALKTPIGSIVYITGICFLVTENRHAGNPFPQIKGFTLIPRGPDDVEIIKRPPWWTPGRLLAVLGVILALLGGIVVWNVMLRRMVERRSRELDRERHAHEQTEARAADRNRLAIELHDLISQSLTGATMQIESIGDLLALDQKKALRTLDIAARTLKSCKQELRNCIWDLRNNALDERHFTRAIRKSLELHSGDAEISIQCDVLRSKLSDNTAHALLCIIRELVANAIHHGKAKSIEIVGTVQGDDLSFSVTDDGCGFDAAKRPGIAEGHFGLQGIEERLDKLSGRMTIQSKINEGTSVSIWIKSEC